MNNSDFEGPPWGWSVVSIVGGLATAIGLIVGLEFGAARIKTQVYGALTTLPSTIAPVASPIPTK